MTLDPIWLRSTACTGGNCVEIARTDNAVLVRDSKDTDRPHLTFTETEWADFAAAFERGEFDL